MSDTDTTLESLTVLLSTSRVLLAEMLKNSWWLLKVDFTLLLLIIYSDLHWSFYPLWALLTCAYLVNKLRLSRLLKVDE